MLHRLERALRAQLAELQATNHQLRQNAVTSTFEIVTGTFDAVVFDLLTALIDSWSLWNNVAGSAEDGLRWRKEYLRLTYGAGIYRDYEAIVAEAADAAGIAPDCAKILSERWDELAAWPEASPILAELAKRAKLAVVTNCSICLGQAAASNVFAAFDVVMTAEQAGCYKPRPEPYAKTLKALGTRPERTLFVAGSAADVPGASALGMPVYWHNRIGLSAVDDVTPAYLERSLNRLLDIV
jgi:2-haloalkanoic acid dehalogenase type II